MNVFRTSKAETKNTAAKFLRNSSSGKFFEQTQDSINLVFNRKTPVPSANASRFAPGGFGQNVLYTSDARGTTIYEYAYHQIKNKIPYLIRCETFVYEFKALPQNIVDATAPLNSSQILDPKSYADSHAWVQGLSKPLDTIRYPNVRNKGSAGTNYAIFNRASIAATDLAVEASTLLVNGQSSAEWTNSSGTSTNILPIM